ncbi:MAG: hypothetical protein ABSA26_10415 [Thermoguttaceae bacterium]
MATPSDSKPNPNETDPCCSSLVSGNPNDLACRHFPWGVISAIPLFIYGAVPLIFGAWGLIFVPAILIGGVSIGGAYNTIKSFRLGSVPSRDNRTWMCHYPRVGGTDNSVEIVCHWLCQCFGRPTTRLPGGWH